MPTVTPDRAALEVAHSRLRVTVPLDEMLKNATLRGILEAVARQAGHTAQSPLFNRTGNT